MKFLLLGSSGWIGQHMQRKLFSEGHDVIPYDLVHGLDITDDYNLYKFMMDADAVIHLAGETGVSRSWFDPHIYYYNNTIGSAHVFRVAREIGKKVIYASTGEVYSGNSPYAASKIGAEAAMDTELLKGADIVALRILNPYGERQPDTYIIPKFIKMAAKDEDITIHGTGEQRKDYLYIEDLTTAFLKAMELPAGTKANLGSGKTQSIKEIAQEIITKTKSSSRLLFIESPRVGEKQDMHQSIEHLTAVGWKPKVSFNEGLERCVNFYGKPILERKVRYN